MIYERPGFVTIAGGKLTTYRHMAAEVVDRAYSQLGHFVKCATDDRPLPGAVGLTESDEQLVALAQSLKAAGTSEASATYLAETYGARATKVVERTRADASAGETLDDELPFLWAQVDEAVEVEFARTLDDVLNRRIQVLLRAKDQGLGVARKVAERMGKKLGWDEARVAQEVERYRAEVASSRAFRKAPAAAS